MFRFIVNTAPANTFNISPLPFEPVTITGVTGFSDWYAGNTVAVPVTVSAYSLE